MVYGATKAAAAKMQSDVDGDGQQQKTQHVSWAAMKLLQSEDSCAQVRTLLL